MLRLALILALLTTPCLGQSFDPKGKVDGAQHGEYNAGRIAELPQGQGQRLKLWVVLSPNWRNNPHEYAVAKWFTSGPGGMPIDARLRQIREGCDWNYYFTTSPLFRSKDTGLMQTVGTATPIVCLTAPDGEVGRGAFLNAATCPRTAAELADLLTIAAEQLNPPPKFEGQQEVTKFVSDAGEDCPDGNCEPAVNETPAPVDGTLQPVVPRRPANALAIVIALGVLLSAGGIALGVSTGKIPLPDAFTDRL